MTRRFATTAGTSVVAILAMLAATATAAAGSPDAGVTAKTVRVGIPYIDFDALHALGVKLTQGSFPDAYNAIIANMNSHGGINGRRIVPYFEPVNPTGSAATEAICTQLTEDDQIFLAMAPYMPDCYLQEHDTPTINATFQGSVPTTAAQNFTLTPPPSAYDPLQLAVFSKLGYFKGKKVGIFAGETTDESELKVVQSSLKRLRVKVVQTAVDSSPATDQVAENQEVSAIAQKFQSAGVTEVVAVGTGSTVWPSGLLANQSVYNPAWIATDYTALSGYIGGSTGSNPTYLKTVVVSTPVPTSVQQYQDPAIQKCVRLIKKTYPSDTITPPSATANTSDHSYIAPQEACQNLAVFAKIAGAAGKKLTVSSFTRAGFGLRNVTFPGSGGAVSFGPGQAYAIGPVYVGKYSVAVKNLVISTKSANS
jgi:hypothetical protein